jgi:hypothetical protein
MNDYIQRVKKDIVDIMFNNPDIFPIVDIIYNSINNTNTISNDDKILYTKLTIDSRIGLNSIVTMVLIIMV